MELFFLAFTALAIVIIAKTAVLVPQQNAFVIERLGRYSGTLQAGFHILVPFVDVIRQKWDLRETAVDIPEQICITNDNVQVAVDGLLYLKVLDPQRASYGIADYYYAITQLAQTLLRSEVGKITLDRTFEERGYINSQLVTELDKASAPWGVKVLRYEIKNITPPEAILRSMQQQITAEREKRALIAKSEGEKQQEINVAEGQKQAAILKSEGEKTAQVNKAQGEATALRLVAEATAAAVESVAEAIGKDGGAQAANLKIAEQYINAFAMLARTNNTMIIPANVSDVAGIVATAMSVLDKTRAEPALLAKAGSPRQT
jgi:regulator of protease activity HflC (stomatin/prohibitin superfamily)